MKDSYLPPPIQIGGWLVQPSLNSLERHGTTVRVTPKVMQVLCSLAANPGAAVTRDQLLEHVWSGTVVTEEVLTRAVSELRKVFEDDPQDPQFIQTIPKVGYRLIAPVAHLYGGDAMPPTMQLVGEARPAPTRPRKPTSLAYPGRWALPALLLLLGGVAVWRWASPEAPEAPLQVLPFSSFPGSERYPALSPDGNQVAFAWAGESGENWDIYLKQQDNDTPLRITSIKTHTVRINTTMDQHP
jgi:DNA-binding winged helix-turn-helix (wHTH) protein